MNRQFERLLEIDQSIRSPIRTTAVSLSERLECSERTIRTDLNFLRDRFLAPLEFTRQKGWFYTDENWCLPMVPMSQGELFALTLGAKMLEAYAGSAYQQELQSAIARLADRLPEETWVNLQQLANESILFRPGASIQLSPEIWQTLERACRERQQVKLVYFTAGRNQESSRVIDPYLLHVSLQNPYVTGYCHNRQAVRDFRVDRIRDIKLLKRKFIPKPDFDPKHYFSNVFQHEMGGDPKMVQVWFDSQSAPYVRERQWHKHQKIDEHSDGSLTLQFEARGLNEIKRWVLFYGQGAIAREPPELVKMLQDEVAIMSYHYGNTQS